jgi:hypothetical protein
MNRVCDICGVVYKDTFRGWYDKHVPRTCSSDCFKDYALAQLPVPSYEVESWEKFKHKQKGWRSDYEKKFFHYLRSVDLPYEYEPYIFRGDSERGGYVPDFFVRKSFFVEVKGLWTGDGKRKYKQFHEMEGIPIIVLDGSALHRLHKRRANS